MAESKRLAAHRASALGAGGTEDEEIPTPEVQPGEEDTPKQPKTKEADMADESTNQAAADSARQEGHSAGFKAANERMNAVFASEHYAGRETLAKSMLANDKLDASEIIALLETSPKASVASAPLTEDQAREAAEASGRETMKAAIDETGNSTIDASGGKDGNKTDPKAEADTIWGRAYGLDQKGVN